MTSKKKKGSEIRIEKTTMPKAEESIADGSVGVPVGTGLGERTEMEERGYSVDSTHDGDDG